MTFRFLIFFNDLHMDKNTFVEITPAFVRGFGSSGLQYFCTNVLYLACLLC